MTSIFNWFDIFVRPGADPEQSFFIIALYRCIMIIGIHTQAMQYLLNYIAFAIRYIDH